MTGRKRGTSLPRERRITRKFMIARENAKKILFSNEGARTTSTSAIAQLVRRTAVFCSAIRIGIALAIFQEHVGHVVIRVRAASKLRDGLTSAVGLELDS